MLTNSAASQCSTQRDPQLAVRLSQPLATPNVQLRKVRASASSHLTISPIRNAPTIKLLRQTMTTFRSYTAGVTASSMCSSCHACHTSPMPSSSRFSRLSRTSSLATMCTSWPKTTKAICRAATEDGCLPGTIVCQSNTELRQLIKLILSTLNSIRIDNKNNNNKN